eukprot:CAMPEP_0181337434 /NCGR_PEP_ID=MMETSP1101-20121128/28011_1 /TAXON_ID=46948 /ORGANISM="Rhodomonas abbreviata, Strain Caron Lab Isolate" /LENGTH=396 /DNA_ID=CAMNT_0023447917 /DNA_START=12 /DNA_END=1199 /DNA_ORIENTATION=+
MALTAEQALMVENFVSVTNADEGRAKEMLKDNKWDLDMSICTYLAMIEDQPEAAQPSRPERRRGDDDENDELEKALAASMAESGPAVPNIAPKAAQAPPPMPKAAGKSKQAKLVNEMEAMAGHLGPATENFRNFAAEGMSVPVPVAATEEKKKDDGLESLFPPPADLLFHGNFDALRKHAEPEEKYCLVNIQKQDEFSSHMLNRDTWKDGSVKTLIAARYVFWQQQFESAAGAQHLSLYPSMTLPIVDIVDPMTGALLERMTGYLPPEEMLERLTRFLDSHSWGKMGKRVVTTQPVIPVSQAQLHGVEGPGQSEVTARMSIDNEDEALKAAMLASMQEQAPPPAGCFDDSSRGRGDAAAAHHYTDSLRVMQDAEFQQSLAEDREKERLRRVEEEEE